MTIRVTQSVVTWVPFIATNVNTGEPRESIVFSEVDCVYKKSIDSTFTSKTLDATNFREVGLGIYEVQFSATELDTLGIFIYVLNGNGTLAPPAINQFNEVLDVRLAEGSAMSGQRYREQVTDNFGNALPYVTVTIYEAGTANELATQETDYNGVVEFELTGLLQNPGLVDIEFTGGGIESFKKQGVKIT